ncbi:MAG: Crp/Fnr family transcriptional regulator [Nitrospirae bacterium YQR-1]
MKEHLRKVPLFSSLNDEELEWVVRKLIIKKYKKNEIVLLEDDSNSYMYIIVEGEARVTQMSIEGKEFTIAMFQSGEYFGELSLIDGKTTSATVTVTKDATLALISKENFFSILHTQNKILDNLLQTLCMRIRGSLETIQMFNQSQAHKRLIMLFNKLLKQYGSNTKNGTVLNIRLTHNEIANMTGLARQTITKVLDEWKNDGIINIQNGRFIRLTEKFFKLSLE